MCYCVIPIVLSRQCCSSGCCSSHLNSNAVPLAQLRKLERCVVLRIVAARDDEAELLEMARQFARVEFAYVRDALHRRRISWSHALHHYSFPVNCKRGCIRQVLALADAASLSIVVLTYSQILPAVVVLLLHHREDITLAVEGLRECSWRGQYLDDSVRHGSWFRRTCAHLP